MITAAQLGAAGSPYRSLFERGVRSMTAIENGEGSDTAARPSSVIADMLHQRVSSLYEVGWQPADIAHLVRRECTIRAGRLVVAVIASEARSTNAVRRAPRPWLGQLEDLGTYDPERDVIVGGHEKALPGWSRAERLDPDEALTISLQVLGQLLIAPRQALLVDPPSAWGNSNRGTDGTVPRGKTAGVTTGATAGPTNGDVDAKALKLIRALLAKAEATTFSAEAETFTAKAQEMMTRYSIDAAVLAAAARTAGHGAGAQSGVESRRVHIDSPYADEKAVFLSIIAEVNGVRSIWSPRVGFATVTGFGVDLHLTDVLFTSLLVQATKASADATANDRTLRNAPFRRAFLVSYASRIGERLQRTRQHASDEAAQQYGAALVPILADREAAVAAASEQLFPETTTMSRRQFDHRGWHAGRAAADRAHLGAGEAITRGA